MRPHDLSGLISDAVCNELIALASGVEPDLAIVEIGSYRGKSTCCLASGAKHGLGAHVWAIDPWDLDGNPTGKHGYAEPETFAVFQRQVEQMGLTDRITPLKAFSTDVAAGWEGPPVGLLYIDGDHNYESVRDDFWAWRPHLTDTATVVFDDLDTPRNPGVREVVDRLRPVLTCRKRAGCLAVCSVG